MPDVIAPGGAADEVCDARGAERTVAGGLSMVRRILVGRPGSLIGLSMTDYCELVETMSPVNLRRILLEAHESAMLRPIRPRCFGQREISWPRWHTVGKNKAPMIGGWNNRPVRSLDKDAFGNIFINGRGINGRGHPAVPSMRSHSETNRLGGGFQNAAAGAVTASPTVWLFGYKRYR
jgi:hypothetical protein